jgi:thioredoxin 1
MIRELTQKEFDEMDRSGPMLLEFYSKTCGPCKMLSFVLKDIDKARPDFPIYQIDFDANRELKERLGVNGFPTMILYRDGLEAARLEGLKQKLVILGAIDALTG